MIKQFPADEWSCQAWTTPGSFIKSLIPGFEQPSHRHHYPHNMSQWARKLFKRKPKSTSRFFLFSHDISILGIWSDMIVILKGFFENLIYLISQVFICSVKLIFFGLDFISFSGSMWCTSSMISLEVCILYLAHKSLLDYLTTRGLYVIHFWVLRLRDQAHI